MVSNVVDSPPIDGMVVPPETAAPVVAPAPAPAPAAPAAPLPLGQQLIGANIITGDELNAALAEQASKGLRLGEALMEMGAVQEEQLLPFVERHLGLPATRLREGIVDPQVVRLIPREMAESLCALAMFKVRNTLCIAMSEPQDLKRIDEIEALTRLRVRAVFAFRTSIERIIPRVYQEGFEVDAVTADLDESAVQLQDSVDVDLASVESLVDGSPIINLVNYGPRRKKCRTAS